MYVKNNGISQISIDVENTQYDIGPGEKQYFLDGKGPLVQAAIAPYVDLIIEYEDADVVAEQIDTEFMTEAEHSADDHSGVQLGIDYAEHIAATGDKHNYSNLLGLILLPSIYKSGTEPTLAENETIAIWEKTSSPTGVFLVYKDSSGSQWKFTGS